LPELLIINTIEIMRKFKQITTSIALATMMLLGSSCATLFSGQLTEGQKQRPAPGEDARKVKWELVAVNAIVFFPIGLVGIPIDFATGAIYRPKRNEYGAKIMTKAQEKAYEARIAKEIEGSNE
jgi:hypothetical protein